MENNQLAKIADNTTVIEEGKRADTSSTKDVDCMFDWICSNILTGNINKCENICFDMREQGYVQMDGQKVEYKHALKNLGVYIGKNTRVCSKNKSTTL